MTHKEENIVNISMMAAELLKAGRIERDDISGHVGLTETVISLAEQFEKEHAGVDWEWHDGPFTYWEEIDSFAEKELMERYGVEREEPARDYAGSELEDETEPLNVAFPEAPVMVYAVAGQVKHELFSGTFDECKAFCEECKWSFMDENEFVWDLEMEDSREDLFPKGYFDAVDYYNKKHGQDLDCELWRANADKLVVCHQNDLPINELSYWVCFEAICGEPLTFDEYNAADLMFDGDPHEIGDEDFEIISAIKRSVNNFRVAQPLMDEGSALEQKIQAAQVLGAGAGGAAGAPVKVERDARE